MKKISLLLSLLILVTSFGYSTIIVGTTGDYAPFSSYNEKNHSYSGKDIKLIKEFTKAKDEDIKFVKTSWKDSSSDFKSNKFDIFVGGVSINPTRQKDFIFSTPLISFNKAGMALCKNLHKYKTIQDIDKSQNLIIENRGGTNEKFALQNLKNAKLLIINENKQTIKSLTKGIGCIQPDIMFTDTVEIAYQHSVNPNLCKIPVQVDDKKSYKAFMFNKTRNGKTLANQFNKWLKDNPKIFEKYKNSLK